MLTAVRCHIKLQHIVDIVKCHPGGDTKNYLLWAGGLWQDCPDLRVRNPGFITLNTLHDGLAHGAAVIIRPFRLFNTQPRRSPTTAGTGVQDIAQTMANGLPERLYITALPPVSDGRVFQTLKQRSGRPFARRYHLSNRPTKDNSNDAPIYLKWGRAEIAT